MAINNSCQKLWIQFTDTVFLTEEVNEKKNDIKCFLNKITMELSDVLLVMYTERVPSIKKIMNVKWENINSWHAPLYFQNYVFITFRLC